MGVLPIQFLANENRESLGLTGGETYHIEGVADAISHGKHATVRAFGVDGMETKFEVVIRIDTPQEAEYYRNGGILPYVLRQIAAPVLAQVS
jgi:aconitate hydratase